MKFQDFPKAVIKENVDYTVREITNVIKRYGPRESANKNCLAAQKHIDKEKDENKKKSLTGMLDVYRAASVDDDGNPVPLDKMAERFEQITGQKPEDWAKENGIETPSKEEIEKINKAANDEIGKLSPEERKKVADEGRTKAKSTCAEIKKKREEIEAEQKELDEPKTEKGGRKTKKRPTNKSPSTSRKNI